MRQALHIFGKDVRCLTYEITAALVLLATYVYFSVARAGFLSSDPGSEFLLPLAAWVLIARLIHAEALPGTRQFWLTRPYSRSSLLTAKVLFVLVFLSLPKLLADAIIVRSYGFSLAASLPGLLWSQILLFALIVVPIMALATLTSSTAQLFFSTLFVLLAVLIGSAFPFGPMNWILHSYTAATLTVGAVVIVVLQYSQRRTGRARFAGILLLLVVMGGLFIPLSTVASLQGRLSKQRIAASQVRVALDSERQSALRPFGSRDSTTSTGDRRTRIYIPLQVMDVPKDSDGGELDVIMIGSDLRIEGADGTRWPSRNFMETPLVAFRQLPTGVSASVPNDFYDRVKDQPVILRGTAYLTVFGNRRTTPVGSELTHLPGIGACAVEQLFQQTMLACLSLFRSPSNEILLPRNMGTSQISYSPFPAELGISPVSLFGFNPALETPPVDLVTMEPLAYIQRPFEIDAQRLSDFEQRPLKMRLGQGP